MTAHEAYVKFLALRQHFSGDYDYFKYSGKIRSDISKFEVRKDKHIFQKLAKRKDLEMFLVANMLEHDVFLGRDLSEKIYTDWLKRKESLSYIFQSEIKLLNESFNKNFVVVGGQHPPVLKLFRQKKICIETLIILDDVVGFMKHWNNKINDPIVWPTIYKKALKYRPFMEYDKSKFKEIIRKQFI